MRIFNIWLIASALFPLAASADDLPRELLLQCEGKSKMFLMEGDKTTDYKFDAFKGLQLRLKDRRVVNTELEIVYGKDCKLGGGIIFCELNEAVYLSEHNATEKRHLWISLVKETGEMSLSIETWTFSGKTTVGKPRLSSRVQRSGICRTIGKPLF